MCNLLLGLDLASQPEASLVPGDSAGSLLIGDADLIKGVLRHGRGRGDVGGLSTEALLICHVGHLHDAAVRKREPAGECKDRDREEGCVLDCLYHSAHLCFLDTDHLKMAFQFFFLFDGSFGLFLVFM